MEEKMTRSNPKGRVYWIELFVSGLGVTVCLFLTYFFWRGLADYQNIWLLPGLYFLELTIGSVICFAAYYLQHPFASIISWIYCGILVVFIVLASFTVGLFYTPVFLLFTGLSLYSVLRNRQNLLVRLVIFTLSILFQLAVMLFFVRYFA
jgi:hypothetical protein